MSNLLVEELSAGAKFVERFPQIGLFASFGGFIGATLAILKIVTIIFGAASAIFGAIAGYYTMRVWYAKWKRERTSRNTPPPEI